MRKVTHKDVARIAGVSSTAVSFVLNGKNLDKVSTEKQQRILKVVKELGYKPDPVAQSMRTNRTKTLGVIV